MVLNRLGVFLAGLGAAGPGLLALSGAAVSLPTILVGLVCGLILLLGLVLDAAETRLRFGVQARIRQGPLQRAWRGDHARYQLSPEFPVGQGHFCRSA